MRKPKTSDEIKLKNFFGLISKTYNFLEHISNELSNYQDRRRSCSVGGVGDSLDGKQSRVQRYDACYSGVRGRAEAEIGAAAPPMRPFGDRMGRGHSGIQCPVLFVAGGATDACISSKTDTPKRI